MLLQAAGDVAVLNVRVGLFSFIEIETFYDRRLREHRTLGYLTPTETRQRHQHALAA
ncbi:hypothetical protein [Streptomyces sp. HM190]|uniref:hypothetical protein n=1 Tax=Streptomyces sp. HM190 TaxID=2695266 RepID=UPI001916F875|nr:hypothetical protein [Streptomyces sp. HM190]